MKVKSFLFASLLVCTTARAVDYPYVFQPARSVVAEAEPPLRGGVTLSGAWEFMPVGDASRAADFVRPTTFAPEAVALKIPSPWNVNAFTDGQGGDFRTYPSYPRQWEKVRIGWMRKMVDVPADFAGRQLTLRFDGLMGKAQIWVNGTLVGENFELFLPSEWDVTELIRPGERNEIMVGVAKGSVFDEQGPYGRRTYVGGSMWGIEMAGIWQDVWLTARPLVNVRDVFVRPDLAGGVLRLDVTVENTTSSPRTLDLGADVHRWINLAGRALHQAADVDWKLDEKAAVSSAARKVTLAPGVTRHTITIAAGGKLDEWTPDTPNLYGVVVTLGDGKKGAVDTKYERFGWRQFAVEGDKLTLNGRPLELRGDSWHFTGVPQMTRRYAWAWYNVLKEAGANAVRLHAMPFPEFYLDVADEMGICVLDESGIWSSDGGPKVDSEEYWASCRQHLTRLVERDRNHPSVFGWSVCNETVPVVTHVYKAPEELVQRQLQEINGWVALVRELDPTRPWISGDGETDRPTDLPTVVGHYGDRGALRNWASQGKPWGVGETSMAYYGTPRQTSRINANRSYESVEGRMEALARESYDLIAGQRELGASYSSVFNIVWYALQPLPLGLGDESRAPTGGDGIFFTAFEEGRAGMQPERLGPWSSTLNPGYDPTLPLYRPWPMFYAIRAANSTPIKPFTMSANGSAPREAPSTVMLTGKVPAPDAVKIFATEGSTLAASLRQMGIVESSPRVKLSASSLAIVDAAALPKAPAARSELKKAILSGATVVVLGVNPESLGELNALLPHELSLVPRRATSLLIEGESPILAGLNHSDFYFSELLGAKSQAMRYGLAGELARHSRVVLAAADVDWQRWNYRPETTKTAGVLRSEREAKPSGAAIIAHGEGLYLSSLDFADMTSEGEMLTRIMLSNLGATFNVDSTPVSALDGEGKLTGALILGAFNDPSMDAAQLAARPFVDEASLNPQPGSNTAGRIWFPVEVDEKERRIDIRRSQITGSNESAVVYLSFRLFSPRSLVNLLAEPDMPHLDMRLATSEGYSLRINGVEFSHGEVSGVGTTIKNLPLEKGWNHVLLKIARGTGNSPWGVSARFTSDDTDYMNALRSALSRSSLEVTEALK